MSLEDAIDKREKAIISELQEKQVAIDDRIGKGLSTENVIEKALIRPFLPPKFDCTKGSVITSKKPDQQSAAIDRIIFDKSAAPPLIHDIAHSIFAIESVCGLVEITMYLDSRKLKDDIERMAPIKAMTTRRYLVPIPETTTQATAQDVGGLSPRSYVIGLPSDPNWKPKTIAASLREIQLDLGPPTHVHGLYVLGIGFFQTVPVEDENEPMYRIKAWTRPDRLFRFSDSFRQSFDRWGSLQRGWTVDLSNYIKGASEILAE
jgi:hypothetical protein